MTNKADGMESAEFPKSARLLSSPQFRRVFDQKQSVSDSVLILYAATNGLAHSRLGLAVSRKIGNAVVRNEWKRQLREAFRLQQSELPTGLDFVALPRRGAKPTHEQVSSSLLRLATRLEKKAMRKSAVTEELKKPHHGRGRGSGRGKP